MERDATLQELVQKLRQTPPSPPPPLRLLRQERQRRYVDFALQMRLLVALIVMEILLVGGGLYYLYWSFSQIFQRNLYRVHPPAPEETLRLLLGETGWVVGALVAAHLLALLVADRLWVGYVKRVLQKFRALAQRIEALDLSEEGEETPNHASVALIQAWRRHERRRSLSIKGFMGGILPQVDLRDPQEQEILKRHLRRIRRVLPPYSRRFVGRLDPIAPPQEGP